VTILFILLLLLAVQTGLSQGVVEDLKDPQDQFMYAHGLQSRKLYDRAEEIYRDFLAKHGEHKLASDAQLNLILCLREQKKEDLMLQEIAALRQRDPKYSKLSALTGWEAEAYYQRRDYAKAAESYRLLCGYKDVDESLKEHASYLLALCLRNMAGKDTDEVLALLGALAKGDLSAERPWRAYALYQMSWRALVAGRLAEARDGFKRLGDDESVNAAIREASLYRLGECNYALRDLDAALAAYERCLGYSPDGASSREVRKRRTLLLVELGRYADALGTAEDWRKRYPDATDYEMDFVHGVCLYQARRYSEARPFFSRVVSVADVPAETLRLARANVIFCLMEEKQYDQAGRLIDEFLGLYPKSSEKGLMLQQRGRIYELDGKFVEAESAYRQSLELFKGDRAGFVRGCELLITMLVGREEWKKAAEEWRRLGSMPDNPDAAQQWFKAGDCERQAGDRDRAKGDFKKVVMDWPKSGDLVLDSRERLLHLHLEDGEFAQAEIQARALLQVTGGVRRERVTMGLALILHRRGERNSSLKVLRDALAAPLAGGAEMECAMKVFLCQILLAEETVAGVSDEARVLERLEAVRLVDDMFARHGGGGVSANLLFLAGKSCHDLRVAGVEAPGFDALGCEGRLWRALWNRKDDPAMSFRGGLELVKLLSQSGESGQAEAGTVLEALQARLDEVEPSLAEADRRPYRSYITALLSDSLYWQGRYTQSLDLAEKVLKDAAANSRSESTSLAWLVKARILLDVDKNPAESLKYATMCYILGGHELYNSEAYMLAIRSNLASNEKVKAKETWDEFAKRYPLRAEERRNTESIQELFK
jgi:tetratricopeptide (TPR) repeat protein